MGYRVGCGNVRPQEAKIQTIRNWPRPTTKKQVKAFLGLVGYYQRFIPGFATLASPLHDLTRKALPDHVTWSEAAEGAFRLLRQALCSEPIYLPWPLEGARDHRMAFPIKSMGDTCAGEGDKRETAGLSRGRHVVTERGD